jgi:hypothetical protein
METITKEQRYLKEQLGKYNSFAQYICNHCKEYISNKLNENNGIIRFTNYPIVGYIGLFNEIKVIDVEAIEKNNITIIIKARDGETYNLFGNSEAVEVLKVMSIEDIVYLASRVSEELDKKE